MVILLFGSRSFDVGEPARVSSPHVFCQLALLLCCVCGGSSLGEAGALGRKCHRRHQGYVGARSTVSHSTATPDTSIFLVYSFANILSLCLFGMTCRRVPPVQLSSAPQMDWPIRQSCDIVPSSRRAGVARQKSIKDKFGQKL